MNDVTPREMTPLNAEERAERFSQGPPRLSRKAIWIAICVLAVLGIGGAFADSSFNVTQPPRTPKARDASRAPQTLAAFLNLRVLVRKPAPPVNLVDQLDRPFTLRSLRDKVVVVTFLDPRCRDVCPVESEEIRDASGDLGSAGSNVAFVVIDANPRDLGAQAAATGFARTGLSSLGNVFFLAGSLRDLNRIWAEYGVTVVFDPSTGQLAHTNVIDIIDSSGRRDYALEPFGNESATGRYVLPANEIERFARGIARYVEKASR
jgi:cytochrome oxidase Cu insertion factor (SCO1/SenC/PrrC family)